MKLEKNAALESEVVGIKRIVRRIWASAHLRRIILGSIPTIGISGTAYLIAKGPVWVIGILALMILCYLFGMLIEDTINNR